MSFLRRMLSADYRAAVAAEAAGNVDLAAERYALAGVRDGAVRMHLARAARAGSRQAELGALRDALHWADEEPGLRRQAAAALGRALLLSTQAEGVATERDRGKIREAAALLVLGEDHERAGAALEEIGDHQAAAAAYSAGGLVERLEQALARDDARAEAARTETDAFASYQTHMRVGRRDDARADLARCVATATAAGDYRRLLDQLDAALLTAGRVELRRRGKPAIVACAAPKLILGRDPLCDLALRAGGVSRQHAELARDGAAYLLRDLDSRNGVSLGGLPLVGRIPLAGEGTFSLGDECPIGFQTIGDALVLRLRAGLDRGVTLVAGADGQRLDLAPLGLPVELTFLRGRPHLGRGAARAITFNAEPLGDVRVQLVRGDRLTVDGDELDVA